MNITYTENKVCEKCNIQIPDEFNNLLCIPCYSQMEADKIGKVEVKNDGYIEHNEVEELDLCSRMHGRFKGTGLVMPVQQRRIYEAITKRMRDDVGNSPHYPKFVYKKTAIDIGCGLGIGSNILSRESKFCYGIDCNEESISFAKQVFERMPNNLYQSGQLSFDVIDIKDFPRELMKFDYICAIEIWEHFKDGDTLHKFIKRVANANSVIFISTPNRNADTIGKDSPVNPHHVREYTIAEAYDILIKYYKSVVCWNPEMTERQDLNSKVTPILYQCEQPI